MWHYQVTRGDNWDYDAMQPLMLADLTIAERPRRVVMQANKNGFFYVLDRQTGQIISATPFVDGITWATRIDSITGRPVESPTAYAGLQATLVSPDPEGAHNWYPMLYDASKGLVFLPTRSGGVMLHAPDANWRSDLSGWNLGLDARYDGPLVARRDKSPVPRGELLAWNPVERRGVARLSSSFAERWRARDGRKCRLSRLRRWNAHSV